MIIDECHPCRYSAGTGPSVSDAIPLPLHSLLHLSHNCRSDVPRTPISIHMPCNEGLEETACILYHVNVNHTAFDPPERGPCLTLEAPCTTQNWGRKRAQVRCERTVLEIRMNPRRTRMRLDKSMTRHIRCHCHMQCRYRIVVEESAMAIVCR